jgi:NADH dehydrogenase
VGQVVTVFGGTGFLGRRVVRHLRDKGFSVRVASRQPRALSGHDPEIRPTAADIRERQSIATAVEGAFGVVNAVSLYVERGTDTFQAVHVAAAERLAEEARKAGIERFIQVSGIGADAASSSPYIRARGQGEQAVHAAFASACVVRPAVMFGPDDAFLNTLAQLLRRLPIYPLFGRGTTRLQPADVEDVGEMIGKLMQGTAAEPITVECGGPLVYTYEELVRTIARAANVNRTLVPVPFAAWHALAWIAELLPGTPVTRNQVELMEIDTVASADVPGFADFGISPRPLEGVLQSILQVPT